MSLEHTGGDTLTACLRHWAATTPDNAALTFADFATDRDGRRRTLTWRQLAERVDAAAAALPVRPGDRVAVLCPQGADYVVGFLAAITAGAIAVPLFDPGLPGHAGRLAAVLADCAPTAVVTTTTAHAAVEAFVDVPVVAVDCPGPARSWPAPEAAPDDIAYLQYTSGSTRSPAGVVITHAQRRRQRPPGRSRPRARPDAPPTVAGCRSSTTWAWSSAGRARRTGAAVGAHGPGRVPRTTRPLAAAARPPTAGAISAAPNFAYDYCASRVTGADRGRLRLDRVAALSTAPSRSAPATARPFPHGVRRRRATGRG